MTIFYFIISLGLLIFIHEFGHFIVAKKAGVGVEKFSLGFGPRLFGMQYGETYYQVSLLPLGGYVKLTGEDRESEQADDPKSFVGKSVGRRLSIVAAGPAMNLLLAFVMMPIVFMMGRPMPVYLEKAPVVQEVLGGSPAAKLGLLKGDTLLAVDGAKVESWGDVLQNLLLNPGKSFAIKFSRGTEVLTREASLPEQGSSSGGGLGIEPGYVAAQQPLVDEISPGGAAEQAGLQAKDRILSINGKMITAWSELTERVQSLKGQELLLGIQRGNEKLERRLTPRWNEGMQRYLIGIQKNPAALRGDMALKRYSTLEAIDKGWEECWRLMGLTMQVVKRLVSFDLSYKSLGGPVRIAKAAGSAARSGAGDFIFFMAFLSLQLGILNLLPIPVLDGGHAFFIFLEVLFRRPVSLRIQGMATQLGMLLLLFLMVAVTVNDIDSLWGFGKIWAKLSALWS